ncbi:hypothetical protein HED60_20045 [Planctomycetales bacterium ZRK34]|nr:hypothetical protein HED60_20045 [Planctomycetales bacterium ZRK34]
MRCACVILLLTIAPTVYCDVTTWRAEDDSTRITASSGTRAIAVYQAAPSPFKPYVVKLFTPGGVQALRDQVADHPHHHGLMFAVSIDGVSFWEERRGSGKQADPTTTLDGPSLQQTLNWRDAEGHVLAGEQRKIQVQSTAGATLLTWRSTLTAPENREHITLSGHHYYGLGMRLVESMDKVAIFTHSENTPGEIVRGTEKLTRGRWVAVTGPVQGRTITIAMFDHPANARHPAWWFTMHAPFAYQSATLNLWKQPMTLQRGQSLRLVYGVAALDGAADADALNTLYNQWVQQTPHKE